MFIATVCVSATLLVDVKSSSGAVSYTHLSDNIIRKDPFYYRCDGGLCFDYLKACEEKYRTNVTESIEEK